VLRLTRFLERAVPPWRVAAVMVALALAALGFAACSHSPIARQTHHPLITTTTSQFQAPTSSFQPTQPKKPSH
jgi:hypothetical protein